MQLNYRGVTYEYNPPEFELKETTLVGKYRGLDWRFRNLAKPPVIQPTVNLKYRGVAYCPNPDAATEQKPVTPVSDLARTRMMNQSLTIKKREQSMLNRLAAQVGLDVKSSDYFNHIQGKIHPSFRMAYERSHAAFS